MPRTMPRGRGPRAASHWVGWAGGGSRRPAPAAPAQYDPYNLPVTHEVALKGHTKLVSCLDVDHSGSRLVSGGHDYQAGNAPGLPPLWLRGG